MPTPIKNETFYLLTIDTDRSLYGGQNAAIKALRDMLLADLTKEVANVELLKITITDAQPDKQIPMRLAISEVSMADIVRNITRTNIPPDV